jgi:transposase-like protein
VKGRSEYSLSTRERFIAELKATANVSRSAAAIAINRRTAYDWRRQYPDFAEEWDQAIECAVDELEAEARRRAFTGVEEPVFYKGEECGYIRKYSDKLLELLLKAHLPNKYRESVKVEVSSKELEDAVARAAAQFPNQIPLPPTFGIDEDAPAS